MNAGLNKCLHCDEFFAGEGDICKPCVEFEEEFELWYY